MCQRAWALKVLANVDISVLSDNKYNVLTVRAS
jgi:hypothetical protein